MKEWRFGDEGAQGTSARELQQWLAPLGVTLRAYPVAAAARPWLTPAVLDAAGQAALLVALDEVFQHLKAERGYADRDLVVLYPEHPQLAALDERFAPIHIHEDEEVRYVVDGEGIFGFVLPDGRQLEVTVNAGDYLHIPAQVEHWFRLTACKRIKAVRYFSAQGGWTPIYSQRSRQRFPIQ
ncbi:MAG: cupin domain-containing protein [Acidithiobacillus sp.]|nr:cupin domain-containing protein [Acidithiobacillus sp.]